MTTEYTFDSNLTSEDLEKVKQAKIFQDFLSNRDPNVELKEVHLQSVDYFGPRVGFIKLRTKTVVEGQTIPGIVLLRGGAVAVFVVLIDDETGKKYSLLVDQPRAAIGKFIFECPAGMLDASGEFKSVAKKEIEEETTLILDESEFVDLTHMYSPECQDPGLYCSVGLMDEFLRFFAVEKHVDTATIDRLHGIEAGERHHGELIKVHIVDLDNVPKSTCDMKTIMAYLMYKDWKREN
ncbi:hypothetical protein PCE1_001430 [Barthelona sp. PCE]